MITQIKYGLDLAKVSDNPNLIIYLLTEYFISLPYPFDNLIRLLSSLLLCLSYLYLYLNIL